MSGIDVASGIAGLITLALQVSGEIAKFVVAVKDHSKNVRELQDEIDLLGSVLSRLNDFIQSERAKGRAFEEDSILVKSIRDCTRRLERIGDKLRVSNGGKISRAIDKLKWPFEQKDVVQLVENLRRHVQTFEFAITIKNSEFLSQTWDEANKNLQDLRKKVDQACDTNRLLGEPIEKLLQRSEQLQNIIETLHNLQQQSEDIKEVSHAVKLAEQREQERRKADILDWLTPISTMYKHVELQNRRAPGTCKWLLESEMFQEWVESDFMRFNLLCQGGPGVGKTVLCSMVIDHLRTKYKSEDVAIVHYYFDLAEQQAQTEYHLARSILRQVCQSCQSIPVAVAEFYQRTRNELQDSLWLQELQTILQRVISTFSQCFIVVDAFDEMDVKKRKVLIGILEAIRTSVGCVKFFATSRPHVFLDHLQDAVRIDVRGDENDIRAFLSQKIQAHPHFGDLIDQDLQERMLDRLCSHADGVFLLPALQIDQILDQAVSPRDIERALNNLSTNLKEVFQSTITRIENFSGGKRSLAFKTLMWVSHARRPLRISELQHAIAVRFDESDFDPRDVSSISVILDSCCGLVELDGESASIRFVHGSIAEYLQSQDHGFFQNAELEIVRTCLKYLTMEQLKAIAFKNRGGFYREMESLPLLDYASSFWGYHARGIDVAQYQDLAVILLNSSLHMLVTARVRDLKSPEFRKFKERMLAWSVSGGAGISLAAGFGLADLTRLLIEESHNPILNARNMFGSTPLHECAIFGYEDTAEVLIEHGADLLDSNRGKATPFYLAVSYGQLEMCKTLLKWNRAQLDVACKDGNTALHKAADLGSESMVEFLLQSGALVEARNKLRMTPLHLAARRGYARIVQMLVLAGADAQATDKNVFTALDYAALGGYHTVVEYFIQQGANINHQDKVRWTAFHRAARSGHPKTVELLLKAGADLLQEDKQLSLPVQLAIRSGNLDTVKAIINHDHSKIVQQLQHQDVKHDRAINIAFYTSNYHIYEYLRDLETETIPADPLIPPDPLLPLSHAIEQGSLLQVQTLLHENPHWLTLKDAFNQTPLHTAFRTSQWSIAEHLLLLGAPINSRGYHGWTPIHIAASLGSLKMLQLALQWNADIFLVSDSLQSPLHKAASARCIPVLIELMRCGCLPSAVNDRAMTPVHIAARQNSLESVLAMIQPEFGSRDLLFARDRYGRTPRDWAERAGHLELSAVLRDEERRARGGRASPALSQRGVDGTNASVLTRQSTRDSLGREPWARESLTRQSTGSSSLMVPLPLPPSLERPASKGRDSGIGSSVDEVVGADSHAGGGGWPSPLRSPGTPNLERSGSSSVVGISEIEMRYQEMQLEFESDWD